MESKLCLIFDHKFSIWSC